MSEFEIYSRLHTGFAMSYAESCQLRSTLERISTQLREDADRIDALLAKSSEAEEWYNIITKEYDELRRARSMYVDVASGG